MYPCYVGRQFWVCECECSGHGHRKRLTLLLWYSERSSGPDFHRQHLIGCILTSHRSEPSQGGFSWLNHREWVVDVHKWTATNWPINPHSINNYCKCESWIVIWSCLKWGTYKVISWILIIFNVLSLKEAKSRLLFSFRVCIRILLLSFKIWI